MNQSQSSTSAGFEIAGRHYQSRLIVGTGKYRDFEQTKAAISAVF